MEKKPAKKSQSKALNVNVDQKAWKFIIDANSQSLGQLNRVAINDGVNIYTYRMMFRQWDRYASVFSALGMTGENNARVGLMGSTAAEVIFAMYALNMVGAEVSLVAPYTCFRPLRLRQTIREEKMTDFIITDDFAMPDAIADLVARKNELGLRNIIILHIPVGGPAMPDAMRAGQEAKHMYLKTWYRPICMDSLLALYGNTPADHLAETVDERAFILHTSGTTGGVGKPVVLSDRAFNSVPVALSKLEQVADFIDDPTSGVAVDFSAAYGVIDQLHTPLALSGTIALVPGSMLNPMFFKAIPEYEITFLFAINAALDGWMNQPEGTKFDFSSLRCVVVGGAAVSAKDKKRYCEFLRQHGADNFIFLNGYGVSELGGACILSTPDLDDESIGYLLPDYDLRLYDEDNDVYHTLKDAPCEGILYLSAPSIAAPTLDDREVLALTTIDGKPFVCTNDFVTADKTGKLTYLGRARRYFINDKGRTFDAGKVETVIARENGIESCCVVPVFMKNDHDNIPMLCVQTLKDVTSPVDTIREVLRKVYITEKTLSEQNLPSRVLISPNLPRNANGKLDLFGIARGQAEGDLYDVVPVRLAGTLRDIQMIQLDEQSANMIKELFDDLKSDAKEAAGSLPFSNNMKADNMNQNTNNFMPFGPMGGQASGMSAPMMNMMNQGGGSGFGMPMGMPMLPMPDFQAMNQMTAQVISLGVNQVSNYFAQMAQTGATMLQQLYMEHTAMVQKAAEQDRQMFQTFEKVLRKEETKTEGDKSAANSAEKAAEEAARK